MSGWGSNHPRHGAKDLQVRFRGVKDVALKIETMENNNENIMAEGQFERGADIMRNGKRVYRVPIFTHWDDDHIRVVERNGEAVVQSERREYSGTRSWGTDEWNDILSLGPVEGIEVVEDER